MAQQRLQQQAYAVRQMLQGTAQRSPSQAIQVLEANEGPLSWSPCDPRDGLSHYLLAHSSVYRLNDAGSTALGCCLALPMEGAASGHMAGVILWHAWLPPDWRLLAYLVQCTSEPQTNGLFDINHCLCVIDVMGSGSLSHSMSMPSSAPMLSPDGYSLLIETWWGLTVRDLPSLHCKFELARPLLSSSNTVSKLAEHLQWWTGGTSGTASILCIWGSQETPAAHLVAIFDAHCGAELHTHLIDFREITGDTYQVTDFLSSFSAKAAPDQPYVAISIGVRAVSSQQIQTFMGDLLAVLDVTTGELVPVGTGLFRDNLVTVYAWSPTGTHLAITEIWYGDARAFHIWDASLRALIHTVDTNEGYRQHACWSPRGGFCVDPTSLELLQYVTTAAMVMLLKAMD
ncbi:hypothetical protein WJX84_010865 [Apatococcus fuscideae]|uniref:Uncharacterized protein n=1 Tax=Apatococcus fuscideae TaxID=2026836 RepID=A0AAW1TB04_9CHLO